MPSGKRHDWIGTIVCVLLMAAGMAYDFGAGHVIVFGVVFMLFVKYMSPDIDTMCDSYQRWGVMKIVVYPFLKHMKHRGYSHHLILGPVLLILYFSVAVAVVIGIGYLALMLPIWIVDSIWRPMAEIVLAWIGEQPVWQLILEYGVTAFAAGTIAAWVHIITDRGDGLSKKVEGGR